MYYLHTCCWVLNMFGIFFILAAHEHYSIDVVIAFYITSRLFLYYHTLANTLALKRVESRRSRVWFPLFWFFEEKISGKVPNEYEWPLKWPAFLCSKKKSTWMIFLWKEDISPVQCLWHTCNGDVKMLCSCKCWLGVFFDTSFNSYMYLEKQVSFMYLILLGRGIFLRHMKKINEELPSSLLLTVGWLSADCQDFLPSCS